MDHDSFVVGNNEKQVKFVIVLVFNICKGLESRQFTDV